MMHYYIALKNINTLRGKIHVLNCLSFDIMPYDKILKFMCENMI